LIASIKNGIDTVSGSLLRKIGYYLKNINNKNIILGNLYNTGLKYINAYMCKGSVKCNICNWEGYKFFAMIGHYSIRYNAVCPRCFSKERHRRLAFYLEQYNYVERHTRCLDIGPAEGFRNYMESKGYVYFSIDIASAHAMAKMDVTELGIRSDAFELVICYHVLEHVENDVRALREIHRVLKSGGKCFIQVPLKEGAAHTIEYEQPDIKDCGHVRQYGRDIIPKINNEGFEVHEMHFTISDTHQIKEYALGGMSEYFFVCQKNL